MSYYLFVLCIKGFNALLRKLEALSSLTRCKIARGGPSISHLFFTDDYYLFFRAFVAECCVVMDILVVYSAASSQLINHQKSSFIFSANVSPVVRAELVGLMCVKEVGDQGFYLGLPSKIGRNKREVM